MAPPASSGPMTMPASIARAPILAMTPDPAVTTELSFQRAQRAKREAAEALGRGDLDGAQRIYRGASLGLRETDLSDAPADVAAEIADEARVLEELAEQSEHDRIHARKRALADHHMKARKRGRGQ